MHVLVNGVRLALDVEGAKLVPECPPMLSANSHDDKTGAEAPVLDFGITKQPARQELAFNTVTARRFCDQHEISLHTATGRSLP